MQLDKRRRITLRLPQSLYKELNDVVKAEYTTQNQKIIDILLAWARSKDREKDND